MFKIKREIVIEKNRARIELELKFVMTGLKNIEGLFEKKSQGATNSHLKRKSTEWKRRSKGSLSL